MKHKLLSILLCLAMALSLLPTAALADGEETSQAEGSEQKTYVAKNRDKQYETLQAAIDAAKGGDTIVLKKSISATEIGEKKQLRFEKEAMNLTLDLNQNTITAEAGEAIAVDAANITLIVKNGTIKNFANGKYSDSDGVYAYKKSNNLTLTFENIVLESRTQGLAVQGLTSNSNVNIVNSKITSTEGLGIYYPPKSGTLTITDSEITGVTGIVVKGSNLVVNGEKTIISGTGPNVDPDTYYTGATDDSSSLTETGDALYIESGYNDRDITVAVQGGSFTSANAQAVRMFIQNGEITSVKREVKVTGGTFNTDVSAYVPDGYIYNGETNTVEQLTVNNAVAKIEDTPYKTLAAAISAAGDGNTVTLLKDVTERVSISRNLVLDLNGKTLTGEDLVNSNRKNERIALTANAGEVKVKNGIIDGRVNAYDSADLTIDADVTVKNSYNGSGYDCFGIVVWGDGTFGQNGCKTPKLTVNGKVIMEKGGVAISTNGTDKSCAVVTINDGAVISTTEDGAIYLPSGKLTMNGGTVSGPTGIQICAGNANITSDFKLNNGTVIATGADQRTSKGTGDGLIPDGAAISVVNRNYPNGVPSVTIDGGSFSSANSDAVLAYTWSNGAASEWTDAKTYVKINDGYFTSDPSAYKAEGKFVVASDKAGYSYMISGTAPTKAEVIVNDKTAVTVPTNKNLTNEDKTAIQTKTNIDGVAEAVVGSKDAIVKKAGVDASTVDATKLIEVEIAVDVAVSDVQKNAEGTAVSSITFTAKPTATVKVNGNAAGETVDVTNAMLNGKPITVKLPLPADFEPQQIKHTSADGSVEYFLKTPKTGAKTFEIKDGCAVFTITKFSTFELSSTVTYVEPSYSSGSSSYDPTYSVSTPSKTENGSVTVSPKSASKGDTVTVTVKPDSGYVLETLTVTDKNGNELTLKDKGNGKYTFTMPSGKVEVKATFMEDNSMLNFFYDVPNGAYFYEAVKWAVKNGITTGVGNDLFAPEQPCTRAQIVTFLWRAAGSPEPKGAASGMTDVVSGSYYEKAVAWAIENGITTGTTTSTFSPDATCTRAQAVTFLARALKAKAASAAEFSDVPTGSYFADAVAWAAANGVTEGIGGGLFGSDNDCTRGQIVTFLYRAYNK